MTQDDLFGTTRADISPVRDVDHLATQVISVLRERQTVSPAGARQFILDYLVRSIISHQHFDPVMVMEELRGHRLTVDAVIDLYIPQAAHRLGDMWIGDQLDFAAVTIGALRLQALLGEASAEIRNLARPSSNDLHAMIVVLPGEQHFLGASVVGAQLRRLGCDVYISFGESEADLQARIEFDRPHMLLFTCARTAGLEQVVRSVKKVRKALDPAPVIALGGALRGDAEGIKEATGVDLVTNAAKDVVGFCEKRRKALTRE